MDPSMIRPLVITLAAYSNTGKTTCLEGLLPCLKKRGLRVAVIKHDGHDFQMDTPGTDTSRMTAAGADTVAIVSDHRFALLEQRSYAVEEIVARITDVDLILTEGFKYGPYPKIALYRAASGKPLAVNPQECLAVVTDTPVKTSRPVFPLNDPEPLAEHLVSLLKQRQNGGV